MKRVVFFVFLGLLVNTGFAQKFFSWPTYAYSELLKREGFADTLFLRDNRPILKYSKYNCSAQEIANDIAISLQNKGVTTFCVLPYTGDKSQKYVLELGFFYSYLNFNIWDSRVDWQLILTTESTAKKFDLISKVSSERNNWGHKSGQKALVYSFEAAMNQLVQQLLSP